MLPGSNINLLTLKYSLYNKISHFMKSKTGTVFFNLST